MTEDEPEETHRPAVADPSTGGAARQPIASHEWSRNLAALGLLLVLATLYLGYVEGLRSYCAGSDGLEPCNELVNGHLAQQLTPSRGRFVELAQQYDTRAYLEFIWGVDLVFPLGYGLLLGFGYAHLANRTSRRGREGLARMVPALALVAAGLDYLENAIITHQVLTLEREGQGAVSGLLIMVMAGAAWLKMTLVLPILAAFIWALGRWALETLASLRRRSG